jgi:hypothetical protein
VGNESFLFRQKLLVEDRSVRRSVVMVKQPGLFKPTFGATSWHVFTQSPQNVAVEPGIHNLACLDRCFALPQLLHRWRHQSGIFWIPPRILIFNVTESWKDGDGVDRKVCWSWNTIRITACFATTPVTVLTTWRMWVVNSVPHLIRTSAGLVFVLSSAVDSVSIHAATRVIGEVYPICS